MNPRTAYNGRTQRGVGMIELLVSVLVLSIGLLGVAWLQTRALAANNAASVRSMSVVASYTILEGMRADRPSAINGDYNTTVDASDCPDAGTLAQTQLREWCVLLGDTLGAVASTTGQIACNGVQPGECIVTIEYDDSRLGDGAGLQTVVTKGIL